jgi:deoxyribonuclease-4
VKLGIHCDVRRGYVQALRTAESLGCEAMQILPYKRNHEPTEREFAEFRAAFADSPVERLVIHVRFLPFLASTDGDRHRRSIGHLEREIRYAAALGGEFLILHMGAYSPGSTLEEGTEIFAKGVVEAWRRTAPESLRLVVENVPGGGRRMGGSLEELAGLSAILNAEGIQTELCLDTAHAWAHGETLDSREGMWKWLAKAHRAFGADRTSIFHLNDTRAPHGSNREHHWHWGRGFLGTEGLDALFEREDFSHAIGILEMPPGNDEANMAWVRARRAGRSSRPGS